MRTRTEGTSRGGRPQEAGRERNSNASRGAGGTAGRPASPGEGPGLRLGWADLVQTDSEPRIMRGSGSFPSRAAREKGAAGWCWGGTPPVAARGRCHRQAQGQLEET